MPIYEYMCETHGLFTAMRPMAESAEPCACPVCGGVSPRVLYTAPALGARDRGRIKAHAINERSADSPRRGGRNTEYGNPTARSRAVQAPDGSKAFTSQRPWALSY